MKKKPTVKKEKPFITSTNVDSDFCEHESMAPSVAPLTVSFGNEDMNKLVDKINEIITWL